MNDPLGTYLHDHLAGANFAIELLEALRDHPSDVPLATLASELLIEIQVDQAVLKKLAHAVTPTPSAIKEAMGWLCEKASRLKFRRQSGGTLGLFESMETLSLGILGKEALWRALTVAALKDGRLQGLDYDHLLARSRSQHAIVEAQRLELARLTFIR